MAKLQNNNTLKKIRKIVVRSIVFLLLLFLVLGVLLALPFVQTKLGKVATNYINKDFGTEIEIKKVAISPFGTIKLGEVLIRDHHQDSLFYIQKLNTSILNFNDFKKLYTSGHPYFGDMTIHGLKAKIIQYKGEKETNLDRFVAAFDDGSPSSGNFRMLVNSFTVYNSSFQYIDQELESPQLLNFTNLNAKLHDFKIKGADVTVFIEQLGFNDHRGIKVNQLTSNFTYTKQYIKLDNLALATDESKLKGKVALFYKREEFSDFNNKVKWDVMLDETHISSNDLNRFYNEFGANNYFDLTTHLTGTLNNFTTENLTLHDKHNSEIIGTVTFKNLFEKEKPYYVNGNFDKIESNYNNLTKILPRLLGNNLPSSLQKLGEVTINGWTELSTTYINSKIDVISNLGFAKTDLSIHNINHIDNASYKGNLRLKDFNVGELLNENNLGNVTATIDVDGKGFSQKFLDTKIKGEIEKMYFNQYNYTNIAIDGRMKMPYFEGYFNSNDPNLRMDFKGLIDLSSKVYNYNFTSQIDYVDLEALHLNKNDSISIFKGNIAIDSKGNSLDNLEGTIKLKNISYQNTKQQYFFTDFEFTSTFDNDRVRTITINSPDIITGSAIGKYKIKELPLIVENAVGSLYANYSPNKLEPNQFLNFDFTVHNKIVEIFVPDISISENTKIKGKIQADQGKFELDFSAPLIVAFENHFNNIKIDIDNKNPLYNTYIVMDSIRNKNYKISDFNLINLTLNDTLFVRTEFKGGSKDQDLYELNLYHTIDSSKQSIVGFKKSEVKFKDYLWYINENETKDNKIVFSKDLKNFDFEKLSLSHNNQSMSFFGHIYGKSEKDLNLNFHDVDLKKLIPSVDNLTFGGMLNGYAHIKQQGERFNPSSSLEIDNLEVNNFLLGNLNVNVKGNEDLNNFEINSTIEKDNKEQFYLNGNIGYKNNNSKMNLVAGFNEFSLEPFSPLLSHIVSKVRGSTNGKIAINGSFSKPEVDGRLYLSNAGLTIPYLNTDYNFDENSIVDVTEKAFLLRNIKITDTKYNTQGLVNGSIKHTAFTDWELDLSLKSNNILALDTEDGDDVYYYGTAFMNGWATIKGSTNALVVNVVGESEKGTTIKIPVSDVADVGDNSYIKYLSIAEKNNQEKGNVTSSNSYQGIELDFDFDIDTDAEVEVILNRETGHAMKGRGYGSLKMEINTLGKFLMTGNVIVVEGEYNFRYKGIIDKKFKVKNGGTIDWDGNPMNARLNIEGIYETYANPGVLLESASLNRKVDTDVSILITGNLEAPNIDFDIEFPTVSTVIKSEIEYQLQNNDIRQNQAFALLSTGSFITAESAGNVAYGPVIERLSSLVNGLLADEDSKLQLGVDYTQGDRLNEVSDRVGFTLATQINDRISINGQVGVPVGGVTESVLVGNVEIQMELNEDGTLRARVFNRENDINYIGEGIGYTQGLGLTYTVDFDTFNELIQKIFKKNKKETEQNEAKNQIDDSELSPDYIQYINKKRQNKPSEAKDEEIQKVPEIN
ncbi:translocation/assembly module TamB domain-containing protein [Flavobacterium sp.]|uniref:translocation/assembly module TamB domain-containing protein n=1 Tax=Flavobacterium sp. TaxID=239 RepID=UPI003529AD2E